MFDNAKKIIFITFIVFIGIGLALFWFLKEAPAPLLVQAGSGDNVDGWAWAGGQDEGAGWISFNSIDCDTDDNGYIDTDVMVLGCGGDNISDVAYDYGVNIDASGNFSGYAWSENLGWVSFQENNPPDSYNFNTNCPNTCDSSNNCTVCHDSTDVYGWAKILNLGNDGWIKLRKDSTDVGADYDVSINNCGLNGWAWNGNADNTGVGWISFDSVTGGSPTDYAVMVHGITDTPQNVIVEPLEGNKCEALRISWSPLVACTHHFVVLRQNGPIWNEGNPPDATPCPNLNPWTNVCSDIGLDEGSYYTYKVRACADSSCNFFMDSDPATGKTHIICDISDAGSWGECEDIAHLSWNGDSDADTYKIYRKYEGEGDDLYTVAVDSSCAVQNPATDPATICAGGVCSYDYTVPTPPDNDPNRKINYAMTGWDCDSGPPPFGESDKYPPDPGYIIACPTEPVWKEIKPE